MTDGPLPEHQPPSGVDEKTVEALGKISEALECIEVARGQLYQFHRLMGRADFQAEEAAGLFREAGHDAIADRIEKDLVGRNVLEGRWTFQIVEEFDDTYYSFFRQVEEDARNELADGRRHIFEASMKEDRRTQGRPHHKAVPDDSGPQGSDQGSDQGSES